MTKKITLKGLLITSSLVALVALFATNCKPESQKKGTKTPAAACYGGKVPGANNLCVCPSDRPYEGGYDVCFANQADATASKCRNEGKEWYNNQCLDKCADRIEQRSNSGTCIKLPISQICTNEGGTPIGTTSCQCNNGATWDSQNLSCGG